MEEMGGGDIGKHYTVYTLVILHMLNFSFSAASSARGERASGRSSWIGSDGRMWMVELHSIAENVCAISPEGWEAGT